MPSSYLVDTSEREHEACRRAFPLHVRVSAHCWKKKQKHTKKKRHRPKWNKTHTSLVHF